MLSSNFVSADKSREEKRGLSPSWSTPNPKQAKLTNVDKTGYFILYVLSIYIQETSPRNVQAYFHSILQKSSSFSS